MTTNKTKERPIRFTDEMIRALLDGRKTQARQIIKPQPVWDTALTGKEGLVLGESIWTPDEYANYAACPYGWRGSLLWVQETFRLFDSHEECSCYDFCVCASLHGNPIYRADEDCRENKWKPSVHMPRWASRITLEITSVRVERLQDISEEDAIAEGIQSWIETFNNSGIYHQNGQLQAYPATAFSRHWQSINGPESWNENPWVWVIEFNRIEP